MSPIVGTSRARAAPPGMVSVGRSKSNARMLYACMHGSTHGVRVVCLCTAYTNLVARMRTRYVHDLYLPGGRRS